MPDPQDGDFFFLLHIKIYFSLHYIMIFDLKNEALIKSESNLFTQNCIESVLISESTLVNSHPASYNISLPHKIATNTKCHN